MIPKKLRESNSFDFIYKNFKWVIPEEYNIAYDICDKHSGDHEKIAMYYEDENGKETQFTFNYFMEHSNRLSNAFRKMGVKKGDRIGVFLPQGPEAAISHLAIFKAGAISVPLSIMFGPEAVDHRLRDCEAKAIIVNDETKDKLHSLQDNIESLHYVIVVGENQGKELDFRDMIFGALASSSIEQTSSNDPAIIIYTSGTTGLPKGALHAHRCIPGRLPGFELAHNFFPQPGDVYWSPADWAWIGGLLDSLFTPWLFGVPVIVVPRKKFDPEKTFHFLSKYEARNAFIPPTALKIMRQVPKAKEKYNINMRSVHSGGEALPAEILDWGQEIFGSLSEMYGMTEMGFVVGNCPKILKMKPGSMGKPYPGHRVEIMNKEGRPTQPGELGEIAIHKTDPGMFLTYWNSPADTEDKFKGDWFLSNDMGYKDDEGYFWFRNRTDDVIISAGYRIGPTEIEKCIFGHPSVRDVAVIGAHDPTRGEIVKAFIELKEDIQYSDRIKEEVRTLVKRNLSAHEYPREIEFIEELPRTTTGKIKRNELRELENKRKHGVS